MTVNEPKRGPEFSDPPSTDAASSVVDSDDRAVVDDALGGGRPSDGPADRRVRSFRILFLWISLALLFVIVWTFLGPVR